MALGARAGKIAYWRMKGSRATDVVRAWTLPIASVAIGGKFLGLQSRWAVVGAVVLAVLVELAAVVIGWLEHHSGATAAEYDLAKLTDGYKVESLALLREIRDRLPGGQEK